MTRITSHCEVSDFWLDYKEGLQQFLLKRVGEAELANDLAHEVLLKVYGSCCSGRDITNLRSWLFQIAHNTLVDYYRRENRFSDQLPDEQVEDENLLYREAAEFIEPLMGFLPEKYALPLRLADIEGVPQQEIATRLGLGLSAVKSRIQRARKLLREEIITCCHVETDEAGNLISFGVKASCKPLQEYIQKENLK